MKKLESKNLTFVVDERDFKNSYSDISAFSPYYFPPTTIFVKFISFLVRVPVLSVKTYFICPKFSFIDVLCAPIKHLYYFE